MQAWSEYNWEHMMPDSHLEDPSMSHVEFLVCGQIPTCTSIEQIPSSSAHVKDYFGEIDFSFTVNSLECDDAPHRTSKANADSEDTVAEGERDCIEEFVREVEYVGEATHEHVSDPVDQVVHEPVSETVQEAVQTQVVVKQEPVHETSGVDTSIRKRSPCRPLEVRRPIAKKPRTDSTTPPIVSAPQPAQPICTEKLFLGAMCTSPSDTASKAKRTHTKRQRTPPLTKSKSMVKPDPDHDETEAALTQGSRTLLRECKFVSKRSGCQCMHTPLITKHKRGYLSVVCGSGHQWVWCRQCCNCSTGSAGGDDAAGGDRGGCNVKAHWFERDAFDTGRRNHMRNAHGHSPCFES